VRLRDLPEMGYSTSDRPYPRGEILAHRPFASAGYFSLGKFEAQHGVMAEPPPASTSGPGGEGEEKEEDGWVTLGGVRYFCTGDVGELVGPGQVRVIDRCKNHFKLTQGIYVAPEPLEEAFSTSELVHQIFVWGHGHMSHVGAVVVPDEETLFTSMGRPASPRLSEMIEQAGGHEEAEQREGAAATTEAAATVEAARRLILRSLQAIASPRTLKAWEIPQAIVLESRPFTEAEGLLTASSKLSRPALIRRYRDGISLAANVKEGDDASTRVSDDAAVGAGHQLVEPEPRDRRGTGSGLCEGLVDILGDVASASAPHSASDRILSLGLDSLGVARLSSALSDRFGVEVPPRTLFSLQTVGELESLIFGGAGALRRAAARAQIVDWQAEAQGARKDLDEALRELMSPEGSAAGAAGAAGAGGAAGTAGAAEESLVALLPPAPLTLLTGSTGFLGAFLLAELARVHGGGSADGTTSIVCLVRAADALSAQARLEATLQGYGLSGVLAAPHSARIVALPSDITKPRLGLSPSVCAVLIERARLVVHAGAQVSSALPYAALRDPNVLGTARVAALAIRARARLLHISTLGFVDPGHAETLQVATASLPYKSGYAQSKWVSERLVCDAAASYADLELSVFRPGVICGCSHSGASNAKDAAMLMFRGLIRERAVSTEGRSPLPRHFNMIPVDTVAAAIVSIGRGAHTGAVCAYHLCAPRFLPLVTLCEWLRDAGYALDEISAEAFCRRVRAVEQEHPLFPLKAQLSRPHDATSHRHELTASEPVMRLAVPMMRKRGLPRVLTKEGLALSMRFLLNGREGEGERDSPQTSTSAPGGAAPPPQLFAHEGAHQASGEVDHSTTVPTT
jgi:fatty acid CoA ligase FadD9